jgi:O-acetyl-ADP-ribose deacetylase (regulator of RNase III)
MSNSIRIATTTLTLRKGDITEQDTDAIVNAANSTLLGGGGVDGAIHRRGGAAILEACKHIRATQFPQGLPTGQAVLTTGGALRARHVIHTVGPIWHGGNAGEAALLASAYQSSIAAAIEGKLRSVAFPSISTGAYGYPTERAAEVALQTVIAAIHERTNALDEVRFVLFSQRDLEIYDAALQRLLDDAR